MKYINFLFCFVLVHSPLQVLRCVQQAEYLLLSYMLNLSIQSLAIALLLVLWAGPSLRRCQRGQPASLSNLLLQLFFGAFILFRHILQPPYLSYCIVSSDQYVTICALDTWSTCVLVLRLLHSLFKGFLTTQ